MLDNNAIQDFVFQALKNINEERGPDQQIELSPDTRLFGTDAVLDSLSLVSVVVDVEEAVSAAYGREISLTNDHAMSQVVSPFSDVKTLTAYILLLLSEA